MRRLIILSSAAAVLAAAALLAGIGRPDAARGDTPPDTARVVTTSGHGTVDAVPDRAAITAGVRVEARTATDALARCSASAERVIAALRAAGGQDLRTQQVSLDPQVADSGKTTGYVAENTVSADAAVSTVGKLIDAATAAGATTIGGPDLTVADQSALYRKALGLAFADARARAQALATAGGFTVGAVESVAETSAPGPVPFAAAVPAAKQTPVEAGTQEVTADVQVGFAIG